MVINNNKNRELTGVVKPQSIDINKKVLNRGRAKNFMTLAVTDVALWIVVVAV
jgi:hypothetical protein